jgi:hypothetical protein
MNNPNGNANFIFSLFTPPRREFFFPLLVVCEGGKEKDGRRGKRMDVTVLVNVEPQDPHEWSVEREGLTRQPNLIQGPGSRRRIH